ncbi:MAG: hypothetical protein IJA03_03355 [Bacteroidaceae bacterium]|nr:hypothetical protein [Bacteroidaceae bacterium]
MEAKSLELKQVRPEDFDVQMLWQLVCEGRLYIQPKAEQKSEQTIREEGIHAILQYVSHIDACASEKYQSTIRQLWERILRSSELGDLFFLNRYKNIRGQPNWYRVNVIMVFLWEQNVYRNDIYTAVQLHMMMEQTDKRSKYYTGMGRYQLERKERSILKKML